MRDYRAGYLAGRASVSGGGGGKPPRGCPLKLLLALALLPYLIVRALIGGR